jgi:hypothetical protein
MSLMGFLKRFRVIVDNNSTYKCNLIEIAMEDEKILFLLYIDN